MRRQTFLWMLIGCTLSSLTLHGQNWAGPDQALCGSTEGATIGLENAPSQYCYSWSPLEGIQGSPHEARIVVKPEVPTTYSVTVTGSNFSFRQVDEVEVDVDFGGVEFDPSFAFPDGESAQSTAYLTNNPDDHPFTWSIVEEAPSNHGCTIDPSTGDISGCIGSGEITVRATRDEFPQCKAENTFRINQGVKDVTATDISTDNGKRVAKSGQILTLVGRNGARFEAIPNDNETFGPNDITWAGSPDAPTSGVTTWVSDQGTPQDLYITANDKAVLIERRPVVEHSLGNPIGTFLQMVELAVSKFKPVKNDQEISQHGSCLPPLQVPPPSGDFNYKYENTNKYNSPDEGIKSTIEGFVAASVTGKLCFPPPYSSPPNPFGYYFTYAFMSGTVKIVATGVKDEGAPGEPAWDWGTLAGEGELKIGLGAQGGFYVGSLINIIGSITGSAALTLSAQWNSPHIEGKYKLEPLIVECGLSVWITSPNEPIVGPLNGKYNLADPIESQYTPIITFD